MGEFCGCSKKKCAFSLGIALLVLLGIELIINIACFVVRNNSKGKDENIDGSPTTIMVLFFGFGTVTIFGVIASLILIVGAIKMRKCLLMAWIVCGILLVLGYTAFLGICIFLLSFGDKLALIDVPFIISIIILTILAIIVVCGLKNEAD